MARSLWAQVASIVGVFLFFLIPVWILFKVLSGWGRSSASDGQAAVETSEPGAGSDSTWYYLQPCDSGPEAGTSSAQAAQEAARAAAAAREYERQQAEQKGGIPNTPWRDFKGLW